MNEDPIAHDAMASFVRTAKNLAAGSRAGARLARAAALRVRSNALTDVLRALEVPTHAASVRASGPGANANAPQDHGRTSARRGTRPLAAITAAAGAPLWNIAADHAARASAYDIARAAEGLDRRPSARRSTIARAVAAAQTASATLSRIDQSTLHANLLYRAQAGASGTRGGVLSADGAAVPPRANDLTFAALLTAGRRAAPAQRNSAIARGAAETDSPGREAIHALAALPVRIRRVLVNSHSVPAIGEFALEAAGADTGRWRRGRESTDGSHRSASTAAPITINSSPSITVNLPPGAADSNERGISRAVAQALEEHAERLYEIVRQVGSFRARAEF